jgi:LacI family transcriptional regulator
LQYRIRDVAERAGVSKSTVSRVLNRSPLVDKETRRRVLDVARKLNYYPNASAQYLARGGHSDFYGLIISDVENPVFPEMIKGFETAAAAEGYDLFLCATNYNSNRTQAAVRKMIENRVRGVAIMTSSVDVEVAEQLAERQIAVVLLDTGVRKRFISNVSIDYSGGVGEALEHLKNLGHERVAFVAGPDERRSARRYRETVVKAIHEHEMELEQIIGCDQTLEGGRLAARKLLGKRLPSAILCINDLTAIGLMTSLVESGVPVPEEISVIGCEDIYLSRFVNPPLTTVKLDRISLGRIAFSLLESMSRADQKQAKPMKLTTHLIVRSSTAARKRK